MHVLSGYIREYRLRQYIGQYFMLALRYFVVCGILYIEQQKIQQRQIQPPRHQTCIYGIYAMEGTRFDQ